MNLFKRKKEVKTVSKPLVIVTEMVLAIIIFLSAIGIKWLVANKYNPKVVNLPNQTVEGITFSDFSIEYEEATGKLTVNAINYTDREIEVEKITLKLYSKDNTLVSEIEIPNGLKLNSNEKYLIANDINTRTRIGKVEYKIGE